MPGTESDRKYSDRFPRRRRGSQRRLPFSRLRVKNQIRGTNMRGVVMFQCALSVCGLVSWFRGGYPEGPWHGRRRTEGREWRLSTRLSFCNGTPILRCEKAGRDLRTSTELEDIIGPRFRRTASLVFLGDNDANSLSRFRPLPSPGVAPRCTDARPPMHGVTSEPYKA